MTRYNGGDRVKAGFYLNVDRWSVTTLSGKGGILPGSDEARYLRVPTIAMLLFAPLMGAAYVVFLPFVGIALVLQYLANKAYVAVTDAAHASVEAMSPAWRPGTAHFAGPEEKKGEKKEEPTSNKAAEDRLKALDEEIEKREQK